MCFSPTSLEREIITSQQMSPLSANVSPFSDWIPSLWNMFTCPTPSTGTRAVLPATSFQLNALRRQTISPPTVCHLSGGAGRHLVGANLHVLNSLCQHPYTQSGGAIFTSVRDGCALKLGRAIMESVGLATVTNTSWPLERERETAAPTLLT